MLQETTPITGTGLTDLQVSLVCVYAGVVNYIRENIYSQPHGLCYYNGSTENAGSKNESPMRDHLDQRATDTTRK